MINKFVDNDVIVKLRGMDGFIDTLDKLVNYDSKYINIKFAAHGFLNSVDEEIVFETYKAINDFIL